jgi:VanZ family protein
MEQTPLPPPQPFPEADETLAPPPLARSLRLPLYLALAYLVLIIYASLYPFRQLARPRCLAAGVSFDAAWPRYWTVFDLLVNLVAYLPLGFLLALALRRLPGGRWTASIVALLLGSLLSLAMECLQNWLPSRVPSNLDLGCNASGTAIGARHCVLERQRIFRRIGQVQQALLAPIPHLDLGLVLLGTWLLTSSRRKPCCSPPATCAVCSN